MFKVELIGVPGAGKSTLKRALVKEFGKRERRAAYLDADEAFVCAAKKEIRGVYQAVMNVLPRDWGSRLLKKATNYLLLQVAYQNKFLAQHGEALKTFLDSSVFQAMSCEDREIVIGGFLGAASLDQLISDCLNNDAVVFFDEGLIQKSMMFVSQEKHGQQAGLSKYLSHIPLPDLTIFLKVDRMSCVTRMKTRPKGLTQRLLKIDEGAVSKFLLNAEDHLETVIEALKKDGRTVVLEVDNRASLMETTSSLLTLLPPYVHRITTLRKQGK